MSVQITVEEWRAALDRVSAPSEDTLNIFAWSKKLGRSREGTSAWVRVGLERGWMERATRIVEDLTGRQQRTVGFRLVAPPAAKTRRHRKEVL